MYSHWDGPNPEPENSPFGEGRRFGIDVINWRGLDNEQNHDYHWDGPNPEPDNSPFGEGRMLESNVINWHRPDNEDSLPVEEDVGRREGLTREDIARLPTKVFRSGIDTDSYGDCNSASGGKDEDAIKECSICKGEFENNDSFEFSPASTNTTQGA